MLGRAYQAARQLAPAVQPVREGWRAARFRAFTARADVELRRRGGRLIVDAPHGALLERLPRVIALPQGDGDATFTLRIGRDVSFGRDVKLEIWATGTNVLELGDHTVISDGATLCLQSGALRTGGRVQIRERTLLKSSGELLMGFKSILSAGGTIHCAERIVLEDEAGCAERVTLVDSDHVLDGSDEYFLDRPVQSGPIVVGSNTFVATGATLTRGVTIGRNSAVAAGAVVLAGQYPGGYLIGGIPAKPLKPLAELEKPAAV